MALCKSAKLKREAVKHSLINAAEPLSAPLCKALLPRMAVGKKEITPRLEECLSKADADERTQQRAACIPDLFNLWVKAFRPR